MLYDKKFFCISLTWVKKLAPVNLFKKSSLASLGVQFFLYKPMTSEKFLNFFFFLIMLWRENSDWTLKKILKGNLYKLLCRDLSEVNVLPTGCASGLILQWDRNYLITYQLLFQVRTDISDDALQSSANSLSWDYNASPVELDNRNNQQMSAGERAERSKSFPQSGMCEHAALYHCKVFSSMFSITSMWWKMGVAEGAFTCIETQLDFPTNNFRPLFCPFIRLNGL